MLILSRKIKESIIIGDCEVTILDISGKHAKVGISAPREIPIYRKEIYDGIKMENVSAVGSRSDVSNLKNMADFFKKK